MASASVATVVVQSAERFVSLDGRYSAARRYVAPPAERFTPLRRNESVIRIGMSAEQLVVSSAETSDGAPASSSALPLATATSVVATLGRARCAAAAAAMPHTKSIATLTARPRRRGRSSGSRSYRMGARGVGRGGLW